MYNANVKTIPHRDQRYDTLGDYFTEGGVIQFRVSSLGNANYEFLIFLHEIIEKQLCRESGITEQMIDAWDLAHEDAEEPGELERCPYREQHLIAEGFERAMAVKLGVDWTHYTMVCKKTIDDNQPPEDLREEQPRRRAYNRVKVPRGKVRERSILKGK